MRRYQVELVWHVRYTTSLYHCLVSVLPLLELEGYTHSCRRRCPYFLEQDCMNIAMLLTPLLASMQLGKQRANLRVFDFETMTRSEESE
jgi:hypothetical protein